MASTRQGKNTFIKVHDAHKTCGVVLALRDTLHDVIQKLIKPKQVQPPSQAGTERSVQPRHYTADKKAMKELRAAVGKLMPK